MCAIFVSISGTFPCLQINFHLRRDPFFDHVGNIPYISSFLLVIAAWASFWLDGVRHMTRRLGLCLGTTIVLILELGGAATWYEEWDLMGNKAQFWLAFCTLITSTIVFETAVVHIALMNCLNKIRGKSPSGAVQVTSEGQVRNASCTLHLATFSIGTFCSINLNINFRRWKRVKVQLEE